MFFQVLHIFLLIIMGLQSPNEPIILEKQSTNIQDSLIVEISEEYGLCHIHEVSSVSEIQLTAQALGSNIAEVEEYNEAMQTNRLQAGTPIVIPVRINKIITQEDQLQEGQEYLKVYYKVRAKDNVYHISKRLFYQPLNVFMKRNRLQSFDLGLHQLVLVGYVAKSPLPSWALDDSIHESNQLLFEKEVILDSVDATYTVTDDLLLMNGYTVFENENEKQKIQKSIIKKRGKAFNNRKANSGSNKFILHRNAPKNSYVELYNPMTKKKLWVKVVGGMDNKLHSNDIDLIVSAAVAQELGAFDNHFLVETRYLTVLP